MRSSKLIATFSLLLMVAAENIGLLAWLKMLYV